MNALGYIRVSTARQAEDGLSPAMQQHRIGAYCTAYGLELVGFEHDNGKSAKSIDGRPGLARLLARAEAGEVGAVVVYRIDRMFRSVMDGLRTLEWFKSHGVAFHSVSESWNTSTAHGEFALTMVLSIARLERRQIGERTADALRSGRQSPGGNPLLDHRLKSRQLEVGRAPYGYLWQDGTLIPHPDESQVVARIRALRRSGKTPGQIASQLAREQVRPRGRKVQVGDAPAPRPASAWSRSVIDGILKRKDY